MSKILTEKDFENAAKKLACEIPVIKAVDEVESRGDGFYSNGFPTILFERHKFHKYTNGRYDATHPEISNAKAGGYGKAGANQRRKFNIAFALDQEAAMMSCSWGRFQIMGFNFAVCGFQSVGEFVDAMKESEGAQLQAFVNFVIGNNLAQYLRSKNWAKFASGYNGKDYKINHYDTKMAAAYKKFSKSSVKIAETQPFGNTEQLPDFTEGERPTETIQTAKLENEKGSVEVTSTNLNQQNVSEDAEVNEPKPQGLLTKLGAGVASLVGGTLLYDSLGKLSGIQFSIQTVYIIIFIIFIAFLGFCVWAILDYLKAKNRTELEANAATDINRKNIKWVKPE